MIDVLAKINKLREDRHWTEYRLAEESGLPQSTISSWYRKNMLPSISSLEKICMGFGITMSQFFTEDENVVSLNPDQYELLERWDRLNPEQKKALFEFIDKVIP